MSERRVWAGIGAAALSLALLAGCGDDGGDAAPAAPAGQGDTSSAAGANEQAVEEVTALLAGDVEFTMPDEEVDPGTHKVAVIASGLASPGPSILAENAMNAIKAIGWTADPPGDGKFTPTTQSSLIEKAVLDKVDGIILVAITPDVVAAAIDAAAQADIPVVCALCGPGLPDTVIGVGNDHPAAGRAQAAYATQDAEPGDTIIVYQNGEFEASRQQMEEAAKHVGELCPECEVETPSLLLAESMQPNAPIFTSLLNQYKPGDVHAVIVPFDSPAATLATAAAQLGRDDFSVIGFGGLSPFVDMVGSGEPAVAKADVLISTPFYGWASVDMLARAMTDSALWEASDLPVGLVDQDTYGNYEQGMLFILPEFDYEQQFTELWGK